MKFLIDTNIFIPLEPTSGNDITEITPQASKFIRAVQTAQHQIYVHPDQPYDLERDTDVTRRELRETLFTKYSVLPASPSTTIDLSDKLGSPKVGTNDWVDNQLIIALYRDAVDYLITEDKKLRNKANRLGLHDRVWSLPEALEAVRVFFDEAPLPPPAVMSLTAFGLDENDPIFSSFRYDYKDFDGWLRKCRLGHRQAWVIKKDDGKYAAVSIINQEKKDLQELPGKKLKICSFKVSEDYSGFHYGELLLKTIFHYAIGNSYDWLYISIFPKYDTLLKLLAEFGFYKMDEESDRGEILLLKQLIYTESDREALSPQEFYSRYGPFSYKFSNVPSFIVPIKPEYHQLLFPDAELMLFKGIHPFGNSIRKAYLCNANIRIINPGDILLFYKSGSDPCITTVGIVEDTMVSEIPDKLVRFVGRRTVYSYSEIKDLCNKDVLAIRFRHAGILSEPLQYTVLKENDVISGPPQSIQSIPEESLDWLHKQVIERLPYYRSSQDLLI